MNDQNLVVDYHPLSAGGHHRILNGQIATPLVVGHERAVIRSVEGKEESFEIQPLARSKMASIPVGINAMFLIDETNKIADASFGNTEAVSKAMDAWMKKSPLKGSYQRLEGTLAKSSENRITINTQEGREQSFAVDPSVGGKLKGLQPGEHVTLFLDANQKILDLSTPQHTGK